MKLYISIDMEGMPGTFNWQNEKTDRPAVRKCMQDHLADVIAGIQQSNQNANITDIMIADSHSSGDNIPYDFTRLDERISLVSGFPRPQYMMPVLDESYDRVFLIGYHAGTGALHGNMDHTYANKRIHKLYLNGIPMNEALINAAYAGWLGIPVTLVSGDDALQKELLNDSALPWLSYITTKHSIAKFASVNVSPLALKKQIVQQVVTNLDKPASTFPLYKFDSPITLRIEFLSTSMCDVASLMPYVKRLDGRTIEYSDSDYRIIFDAIETLVVLAASVDIS